MTKVPILLTLVATAVADTTTAPDGTTPVTSGDDGSVLDHLLADIDLDTLLKVKQEQAEYEAAMAELAAMDVANMDIDAILRAKKQQEEYEAALAALHAGSDDGDGADKNSGAGDASADAEGESISNADAEETAEEGVSGGLRAGAVDNTTIAAADTGAADDNATVASDTDASDVVEGQVEVNSPPQDNTHHANADHMDHASPEVVEETNAVQEVQFVQEEVDLSDDSEVVTMDLATLEALLAAAREEGHADDDTTASLTALAEAAEEHAAEAGEPAGRVGAEAAPTIVDADGSAVVTLEDVLDGKVGEKLNLKF